MAEGDGEDDKVKRLPVRFKTPSPPERSLLLPFEVGARQCFHKQFLIDAEKAEVECADCHALLNPLWVLAQLAHRDHRFHEAHRRYAEEMKRLEERSRTRCQGCGRMTRISRR
jgi:ribosomal protein S27E